LAILRASAFLIGFPLQYKRAITHLKPKSSAGSASSRFNGSEDEFAVKADYLPKPVFVTADLLVAVGEYYGA
jgi:hypothetical protein